MRAIGDDTQALLLDLDGVLTQTALVHEEAWKQMFDEFLAGRGEPEFTRQDYLDYVDGKPRLDGVRAFLQSRGIELPLGSEEDGPGVDSVTGLGTRKNRLVLDIIENDGVKVYDGSLRYLDAVAARGGLKLGVVSSSANCRQVLGAVGLLDRFAVIVDGNVINDLGLNGKPAPDSFLEAARELGVDPAKTVVFEDAISGVKAGAAGNFQTVVGVNRGDSEQHAALQQAGADLVVDDLSELL